ncbi:hypothetical protein [Streptomyces lasiicapitis]
MDQVLAQLRIVVAKCGGGFESVNGIHDEVDETPGRASPSCAVARPS